MPEVQQPVRGGMIKASWSLIVSDLGEMPDQIMILLGGAIYKKGLLSLTNGITDYIGNCHGIRLDPDRTPQEGGAVATFFWGTGVWRDGDGPSDDFLISLGMWQTEEKVEEMNTILVEKFGLKRDVRRD